MLLKEEMSRQELLDYLYQFDKSYGDGLDNSEIRFIFKECELGNTMDIVPNILNQFYSEYNLIDDKKNIYHSVLKKLKDSFSLTEKNILEVGGGPVPILGRLIAKEAKTITVMDTNISIKNSLDNMFLKNSYFLPFTDIKEYDLVVSYMACGAFESIIHNCTKNNIDFFLGLCPCGKEAAEEVFNNNMTDDDYMDSIIEYASKRVKENDMGTLNIEYLEDQPLYTNPIIYNKRKKLIYIKR